jgi:hypothetical protein
LICLDGGVGGHFESDHAWWGAQREGEQRGHDLYRR